MIEFLTHLLSQIIDHPKDLKVEEMKISENNFSYIITLNQEDIGKVIGREGKIIQSIRNVAKILSVKKGIQARIEIAQTQ